MPSRYVGLHREPGLSRQDLLVVRGGVVPTIIRSFDDAFPPRSVPAPRQDLLMDRRGFLRGAGGLALGAAVAGCGPARSTGGPVTVEIWHGQTDTGKKVLDALVAVFHRPHPCIRVDHSGGCLAHPMLQKDTQALASRTFSDMDYIY